MKIKIKTLKGDSYPLTISSSDCVYAVVPQIFQIKQAISTTKGIPVQRQKLIYRGRITTDAGILTEMGVREDDEFILMKIMEKKSVEVKQHEEVEEKREPPPEDFLTPKQPE
jgi:hypothetical protein